MSDEPYDEWEDEDDDEAETYCIQCRRYFWPDELEWKICQECRKENTCPEK